MLPPADDMKKLLLRYVRVYGAMWRNSVAREMQFKINFLLWIGVELLWFALQLAFIEVIYRHTDTIGDWTRWQVVMLIGTSHFIQQIFTALLLMNCANLSELVRTGKMDFLLLLPVNTRFLISLRQVDLGGFINAGSALAVVAYSLVKLNLLPTFTQIVCYLILCAVAVLAHYSLMFMLATVCFWTTRAQSLVWSYYNLFHVSRLPDSAFTGYFRSFFTFCIPMLLVANVPAKLLASTLENKQPVLWLFITALACFACSEIVWRLALKRYSSASS